MKNLEEQEIDLITLLLSGILKNSSSPIYHKKISISVIKMLNPV